MQDPIGTRPVFLSDACSSERIHLITRILQEEAESISNVAKRLDGQQVDKALTYLQQCQGKVIVSGVGKSGIIARKISATFSSMGTTAIFLHPCEALHGDLGIVNRNDVAILISNSGETSELLTILPHIHSRQVPTIGIVGRLNSTLARNVDAVLDAAVSREADPLNLAPTASTTVALALGDAIALVSAQARGTTPEIFALNHPGGRLGKRLTLRVGDLMHGGADNPQVMAAESWLSVVSAISRGCLGAVSVVDHHQILQGIITDGDLRRALENVEMENLSKLSAATLMTPEPTTITPERLAYDALQLMENRPSQISVLPVVDKNNRSLGLLRIHDIFRSGL
ncbi:MAG: KpsF/GutQ family sugar-phosphate isomerase [Cyanobacteria bacterium P01_H01_bin.15]